MLIGRPPQCLHGHPADGRLAAPTRGGQRLSGGSCGGLKSSGWIRAALDRNGQQAVPVAP